MLSTIAALQGLGSAVSSTLGQLQGEVLRQTRRYREIADLSYEEFQDCVTELNQISSQFLDTNGKQLVFAVKKGTDSTALWKGTVKVSYGIGIKKQAFHFYWAPSDIAEIISNCLFHVQLVFSFVLDIHSDFNFHCSVLVVVNV